MLLLTVVHALGVPFTNVHTFYRCSQLNEELAHLRLVTVHLGRHLKKMRSEIVSQQVIPTIVHVQRFPFSRPSQGLASIIFIFIR